MFGPTFDMQPTLFAGSRDVPVLPADSLGSDQFVPLKLEVNVLACVIPDCSYHFVVAVWRAKEAQSANHENVN